MAPAPSIADLPLDDRVRMAEEATQHLHEHWSNLPTDQLPEASQIPEIYDRVNDHFGIAYDADENIIDLFNPTNPIEISAPQPFPTPEPTPEPGPAPEPEISDEDPEATAEETECGFWCSVTSFAIGVAKSLVIGAAVAAVASVLSPLGLALLGAWGAYAAWQLYQGWGHLSEAEKWEIRGGIVGGFLLGGILGMIRRPKAPKVPTGPKPKPKPPIEEPPPPRPQGEGPQPKPPRKPPREPEEPPFSPVPESYINPRFKIDMRNAPASSATNAAGFPRNGPWFWKQMLKQNPELFSPANRAAIAANRSPRVDPTWIKHNPSHQSFLGDKLVHHHIDQGPIAVGLPQAVHQQWTGPLHPNR